MKISYLLAVAPIVAMALLLDGGAVVDAKPRTPNKTTSCHVGKTKVSCKIMERCLIDGGVLKKREGEIMCCWSYPKGEELCASTKRKWRRPVFRAPRTHGLTK